MLKHRFPTTLAIALLGASACFAAPHGVFESSTDVGVTPKPGAVEFDAPAGKYRVTGGGANIWGTADAFQFVWKRVSGDVTLTADIAFEGAGVDAHRKAVLMIRQDLAAGSAYADAALHGDGLTSLQYRDLAGGQTKEAKSDLKAPVRLRLERRGNEFRLLAGATGGELKPAGPVTVTLKDPVYVGIGVSAHNAEVLETAVFSNVQLQAQAPRVRYRSRITVYDLKSRKRETIHTVDELLEAPNWSRDGGHLLVNMNGSLYRIAKDGQGGLQRVALDAKYRCNNDHDYSPDGKLIAISASTPESRGSRVYVVNADGSNPRLVTPLSPSYFHGWSPDGKWLAFVGQRDKRYNLFRVSVNGGDEQRLTSKGDYDDGPDYSPDGKWLYFNSIRDGDWDIWRVPASGGGEADKLAEQVTTDDWEDWFPHVSPDGKKMVFLSFPPKTEGHNGRMPIRLRMMKPPGKKAGAAKIETVAEIFGGQGTINVNSWSPDSQKFAFVVYEAIQ
jgi:hypothetical protein